MKRIFTIITLLAMIILAGCTDLDDINRQLDEQEKELATVRALLNAMTNKVSVVSYKELPDGSGYELTMSDGTKITLKHGAKGNQGERGAKGRQGEDGQDASADLTITETDDVVIIVYNGVTYTIAKESSSPVIDTGNLIGMWYWVKSEKSDGSGGWEINPGTNEHGYWCYFRDASTVFYSIMPTKYQYTLAEDHLSIGTTWDYTIVSLDDHNLVLENKNGYFRTHYTRGEIPPAIDPAKLIGQWAFEKTRVPDKAGGWKDDASIDLSPFRLNFHDATRGKNHRGEFTYTLDWNYLHVDYGDDVFTSYRVVEATESELVLEFVSAIDGTLLRAHCTHPLPNPLSHVAEYNVNPAGNGFVTSLTACNASGYFTFDDAVDKFGDITLDGKRYHLPSKEEWQGIVPGNNNHVNFSNTRAYNGINETVTVQGESITMKSDFRTGVKGVSYGLRYKGTKLLSAWRYEYIRDGNDTHLKITSRGLQGQTNVTVGDIAQADFWSANAENDVIRYFPASGFFSGSYRFVGSDGYFWSSSGTQDNMSDHMYFSKNYAGLSGNNRSFGFSVRLFTSGDQVESVK
ncbi:MAG: hypothetical protein QM237_01505 [Bacteroidota bacterium]|jgi:hypothetical protein|nr:hypothetical protein [Bacteroidota bacterium]